MTIYPTRLTSVTLESYSPSVETDSQSSNVKETSTQAPLYYNSIKQKKLGCLAKLQLDDGNSLYARLVVGADGSKSRIREISGIKTTGWLYPQNAVICTVEHAVNNHCAWQRFLQSGPIALLPIGDKYSNIVWTMNPKEASDRKLMSEVEFVEAVNHALDYGYGPYPSSSFLGQYRENFSWIAGVATPSVRECFQVPPKVVKLASGRMAFPLSLMHANDYVSHRVVLIGDAAHTVHPLAGQGVNLGFEDALTLSKVIAKGISVGSDIGEVFSCILLSAFVFDFEERTCAYSLIVENQRIHLQGFGVSNGVAICGWIHLKMMCLILARPQHKNETTLRGF